MRAERAGWGDRASHADFVGKTETRNTPTPSPPLKGEGVSGLSRTLMALCGSICVHLRPGCSHLFGVIGNDRVGIAVDIQRVKEAVRSDHVAGRHAEFDDFGGREMLGETPIRVIADAEMIGCEQFKIFKGEPFPVVQLGRRAGPGR